ncbi:Hemolysin activation/secretion protein [Methyloversatilis universalis FAM5]|uniref:Hemolysin activation/secretion protein n=1 Tax=Methyloversatilis universalis (strain ATCC BAA-1314 / DSM 25237 / JCM 13912 / CCUG 52030 / FAM5) TaxID=1000565 RepID=F5RI94_METUF|nr:ShlB/FhaC/HecB family hemolysin secretion/activation protein [Methyloversatilis universalis]EGK70076.1 Hemolysin activation/secretion protein [Methyloversatilis universalis FAM5]
MSGPISRCIRLCATLFALCIHSASAQDAGRFDILEFVVEGNTVLPPEAVERAVYPHLGPRRNAADVNAAAAALEKAYQDAGYMTVAVGIPEQATDSGVITLEVTEGRIERLRVTGAEYTLPSAVRDAAPSLAEGGVPHFPDVQEDLGRLGRNADLRVTPLLQPGRIPGSVNVELRMEDSSPLHGSIELNNKRSADTETGRLEATLRYDNLWQRRHSIGLTYFSSPRNRDEVEVFGLNYAAPVGDGILAAFFARSNSNVPTQFDTASLGRGDTLGARYVRPLPDRGRGFFHSISLGLDYKDNDQDTRGIGGTAFVISQPVRYWVMSAQYGITLPFESGARLRLGTTLSAGSTGLNERYIDCNGVRAEQFACRRAGATPSFFVSRFELEGSYPFAGGWLVSARADAQRTSDPLINSEQFSAGGVDSVRGYLESERMGDEGERLRLELATPTRPFFDAAFALNALMFYDWAGVRIREAFAGQDPRSALESAGLGLRLLTPRGFKLHADWAYALRDGAVGNGRTREGDHRLLLKLAYEF